MYAETFAPAPPLPKALPPKKRKIPASLVKETIDGVPFYYAGYQAVLNKTQTLESIMADSGLQGFIKSFLMTLLAQQLDLKRYRIFMGEIGSHLDHRSNLALDLAVFDKNLLSAKKINLQYIDVAPKIVVEVDVNVQLEDPSASVFEDFVLNKVRKLHAFGTEKIIWVFSKSRTVIVARPDNKWDVLDWNTDIELLENITFNIARHLEEEGIMLPSA